MTDLEYPIEMVNGVPVVAAPADIDASNVGRLDAVLLDAPARGHATFVVDISHIQFCGSSGVGALVQAHKRAVAGGVRGSAGNGSYFTSSSNFPLASAMICRASSSPSKPAVARSFTTF